MQQTQERQQLLFRILITALLLSVYGFYLAHQFNLTVGDLGRHLKNGQLFIETGLIPKINLYSYAYPDYPFINHHWGSWRALLCDPTTRRFLRIVRCFYHHQYGHISDFHKPGHEVFVFCDSRADRRHRSSGPDHSARGETRAIQLFVWRSVSSSSCGATNMASSASAGSFCCQSSSYSGSTCTFISLSAFS